MEDARSDYKNCSKCGVKLTPKNTLHNYGVGGKVRWCDDCWEKFWSKERNK